MVAGVGASDASKAAGGATWAELPPSIAEALYGLAELRGTAPLLTEAATADPVLDSFGASLPDWRQEAARICLRAPWKVLFFFRFSCRDHINVLELRAFVRLVLRLASQGLRRSRVLVGLDSSVVVGAPRRASPAS